MRMVTTQKESSRPKKNKRMEKDPVFCEVFENLKKLGSMNAAEIQKIKKILEEFKEEQIGMLAVYESDHESLVTELETETKKYAELKTTFQKLDQQINEKHEVSIGLQRERSLNEMRIDERNKEIEQLSQEIHDKDEEIVKATQLVNNHVEELDKIIQKQQELLEEEIDVDQQIEDFHKKFEKPQKELEDLENNDLMSFYDCIVHFDFKRMQKKVCNDDSNKPGALQDGLCDQGKICWGISDKSGFFAKEWDTSPHCVCFVGGFNTGKSLWASLLSKKPIPSGGVTKTEGISIIFHDEGGILTAYLDCAGRGAPISLKKTDPKNEKLSKVLSGGGRTVDEQCMDELIISMSDCIVYVLSRFDRGEQERIFQLSELIKQKRGKMMIVIHNIKILKTVEEVEYHLKDGIFKNYNGEISETEISIPCPEEEEEENGNFEAKQPENSVFVPNLNFQKLPNSKSTSSSKETQKKIHVQYFSSKDNTNVVHVVSGDHTSIADYNHLIAEFIRQRIRHHCCSGSSLQKKSIQGKLQEAADQVFRKYFNTEQENPVKIEKINQFDNSFMSPRQGSPSVQNSNLNGSGKEGNNNPNFNYIMSLNLSQARYLAVKEELFEANFLYNTKVDHDALIIEDEKSHRKFFVFVADLPGCCKEDMCFSLQEYEAKKNELQISAQQMLQNNSPQSSMTPPPAEAFKICGDSMNLKSVEGNSPKDKCIFLYETCKDNPQSKNLRHFRRTMKSHPLCQTIEFSRPEMESIITFSVPSGFCVDPEKCVLTNGVFKCIFRESTQ